MTMTRSRPAKVLFVSHEASRTGAVIALLRTVEALKQRGAVDPHFYIRTRGSLFDPVILDRFRALGPTTLESSLLTRLRHIAENRLPDSLVRSVDLAVQTRHFIAYRDVELIWFNTLMNGPAHTDLALLGAPRVCHVHELGQFLRRYLPESWMQATRADVDLWAVVSDPVAEMLVGSMGIEVGRVRSLPGGVSTAGDAAEGRHTSSSEEGRKWRLATLGPPGSRKGSDLFVQVALRLKEMGYAARVHLDWYGGEDLGPDLAELREDVVKAGLSDMVTIHPAKRDPDAIYSKLDLLLVPSREEPLSLVMLEAAGYGVPTVAFEGSGGPAAYTRMGGGVSVSYLDTQAMAAAVAELLEDLQRRRQLGRRAREIVDDRYRPEAIADQARRILSEATSLPGRPWKERWKRTQGC